MISKRELYDKNTTFARTAALLPIILYSCCRKHCTIVANLTALHRAEITALLFAGNKGLLSLGKYHCIDFAGQIAALSLCMIQYNILGCVKRFEAYETIGGLFAEVTGETVELSVAQRIWGLIVEVINVIAEHISCDPFELIEKVINNNNQIKAVKQAFDRLALAGSAD